MKTHLIIETSLDDLRNSKNKLVDSLNDNLLKWGDDTVETKDGQIYFFRVISVDDYTTKLMTTIGRGYDHVDLSKVMAQIMKLVEKLSVEIDKYDVKEVAETPINIEENKVEAPEAPETNENEEDDLNDLDNQE